MKRRRRWRRLLWFRVVDLRGHVWRVYLATPDLDPDFARLNARAYADLGAREIVIDAASREGDQNTAVVHELLHVALSLSRTRRHHNEMLVRYLEAHLAHMLGLLRFRLPARPRGYRALRAHGYASMRSSDGS